MLYKLLNKTCSTTSNVASLSDLNTNFAEGTSQTSGALSVPGIVGGMFSGIRDKSPPSFVIQTTHPPLTPSPALVVDTFASDLAASQQASPSSTSLAVTTGRAHAASNSPKTDDTYATSTEVSSDIVLRMNERILTVEVVHVLSHRLRTKNLQKAYHIFFHG